MNSSIDTYLKKHTHAAPLAVFRIGFGTMMLASIIRFWLLGWIDKLYIQPKFFFNYYGFEWIHPLGKFTYLIFAICALASMGVIVGYKYRASIILFFLSFTYIELMDKTTYLNHYYFISCMAFIMIFLPANAYFSLDAYQNTKKAFQKIPQWTIDSVKLLLGIVYFYAGLAKLNSDWLFKAMPLKIWLPSKYDIPILGNLFQHEWMQFTFSWSGAIYDLCIPFLLLYKRTRGIAFTFVVVFHVLTRMLFPIGMFPYIMIVSTLIFFESKTHKKILGFIAKIVRLDYQKTITKSLQKTLDFRPKFILLIFSIFFVFQFLFPWRYLLYPGELFWTEEGYRFSWRVMLMEKAGYAQFKVVNQETGKGFYVQNKDFLTPFQEKQMSTQPDFILQYAHYLGKHFIEQGHKNIAIYVECYVALNGRLSQPYVDPTIDLMKVNESFCHKDWILPFNDNIKGL